MMRLTSGPNEELLALGKGYRIVHRTGTIISIALSNGKMDRTMEEVAMGDVVGEECCRRIF
jgi:hypothetical protein